MNYQDVTPDYLVYNNTVGAADATLLDQIVSFDVNGVGPFVTLNYNLIQHVNSPTLGFIAPVVATPAVWVINTGASVANTTYSVNILQIINGVVLERQISYTTPATLVGNDAAIGLAGIITKLLSVGTFELTSAVAGANIVTITATAANPAFTVSVGANVTVTNPTPAVPARGQGSDLLGIVGLNGAPVLSGAQYSSITIDYQADRIGLEGASRFQRKQLILLVNQADGDAAAFEGQVEGILNGSEPTDEYISLIP